MSPQLPRVQIVPHSKDRSVIDGLFALSVLIREQCLSLRVIEGHRVDGIIEIQLKGDQSTQSISISYYSGLLKHCFLFARQAFEALWKEGLN